VAQKIRLFRSPQHQKVYEAAYDGMLQRWPVPNDEIYLSSRFGRTHIVTCGGKNNPPLILIHSAGSGAVQWFQNVGPLSQKFRIYALDVIGEVNKSNPTMRLTRRGEFVEWLEGLLDGLQIERADFVGNSFGGYLTAEWALNRPDRVRKAVLISPAAVFKQIWAWYWHLAYPYKLGYFLGSKRLMLSGFNWLWQGFPRDKEFRQYTEYSKINGFPVNQLPPPVFNDTELQFIKTPTLLLIGDREVIYDLNAVIQRAKRLMPFLKADIIPHANHNAQVTAPDIVNQSILDFLNPKS
jgi:pimeloyl-ACP methyl ester carboxylesterase